ncbi:MAG: SH3 domain-containing protein [Gemmatimonadaceae bacterium]
MPTLEDKYAELTSAATASGVQNLAVRAQGDVLYIDGETPSGAVKDQLWAMYDKLDPDFRSGDLVLNLTVSQAAPSTKFKVTTESTNLNIRKGPGTDQPIIGKAAHNSEVTLLSNYNDEWALIRSDDGAEGYCSKKYLTAL